MKNYIKLFSAAGLSLACANIVFSSDVAAPNKRAEVTGIANNLLNPAPRSTPPAIYNPFTLSGERAGSPSVQAGTAAAVMVSPVGNTRDLLEKLAAKIEPSGTVVMGGEAILLLGQNRLKVGDLYSINFEGATYEVEVIAIESTRFSIRYKNEELTRPIVITKSGI